MTRKPNRSTDDGRVPAQAAAPGAGRVATGGNAPGRPRRWTGLAEAGQRSLAASAAARRAAMIADLSEGDPLPPVHPGEMLEMEFLRPLGLSPIKAAGRLGVPRTRIERLVAGETSMTPDTALRLERLFGWPAEMWMDLQTAHDMVQARRRGHEGLAMIEPLTATEAEAFG